MAIRTAADLSDEQKAEIRRLYVDEQMTIARVTQRMDGVQYKIVSEYLRQERLTRSSSHYAKTSPWRAENTAGVAVTLENRKKYGRR